MEPFFCGNARRIVIARVCQTLLPPWPRVDDNALGGDKTQLNTIFSNKTSLLALFSLVRNLDRLITAPVEIIVHHPRSALAAPLPSCR
jgi:hypothetical protein